MALLEESFHVLISMIRRSMHSKSLGLKKNLYWQLCLRPMFSKNFMKSN